ncbi:MAG: efflux RND transporter periplasmic adaptor subunit [Sulfuritalea sp.]|nr:efflux RND transporter periplasmic adaptor subunit [Sulfuritalea sp.]
MNKTLIALLVSALFVSACERTPHGHDHGAKPSAAAAHGHDHGPGAEKITHFTDKTELFVEFPHLVAGETSAFAAHLTTLADFRALAAAKVTVILSGDDQPEERFTVETPNQPGIFRPAVQPKQAGERELAIEVVAPQFTVRHELGPVTIYPDRQSADAAGDAHEAEGSVAFTKEQQWKVDFATVEVVRRPIRPAVAATGTIRARPDGEALLTAPAAGQVQPAGRFPRLGQAVKRGDLLAYLVPRLGGETDYAALQAGAAKARVALEQAERERARMATLFKDEAVAEKRLLDARAAEAAARAEHDAASRRLNQYGGNAVGGVPLRAPVSGLLADVRVSPGAFAAEGALLFHIVDRRALWLELRVPESEAVRLVAPSGASFRVDGIDASFEIAAGGNGRLVAVGGAVDQETRSVPVLFEFAAPDPRLFVGMGVKAQVFAAAPREAVAIPTSAVLDENGVSVVFVMTGGESFERRPVRPGTRDGDWIEVLAGLEPGQRVVSRGAWLVKLAASNTGAIGHGHAH